MQSCICSLHMDEVHFSFKMPESCPFPGISVTAAESCIVHKEEKTPSSPSQTCGSYSLVGVKGKCHEFHVSKPPCDQAAPPMH